MSKILKGCLFLFICSLCGMFSSIVAQDDPQQVNTVFSTTCIEALGETHFRIHFGYTSDGVETYMFQMGDIVGSNSETLPYSGYATTNVPAEFTTEVGEHYDWYLDEHSEDSPYTFHLIFTALYGYADLPLQTWDFPFPDAWCNGGAYSTPVEGSTPEPTSEYVPRPTPTYIQATPAPIIPVKERVYWAFIQDGTGAWYWSRVNLIGRILDLPPTPSQ